MSLLTIAYIEYNVYIFDRSILLTLPYNILILENMRKCNLMLTISLLTLIAINLMLYKRSARFALIYFYAIIFQLNILNLKDFDYFII